MQMTFETMYAARECKSILYVSTTYSSHFPPYNRIEIISLAFIFVTLPAFFHYRSTQSSFLTYVRVHEIIGFRMEELRMALLNIRMQFPCVFALPEKLQSSVLSSCN